MPLLLRCRIFLWKILFPLQDFSSLRRYISVGRNTKAACQKQESAAGSPNI